MKKFVTCMAIAVLCAAFSSTAFAGQKMLVAGAGPSAKVVQLFFDNFAKTEAGQGHEFVVPPLSIKHAGGLNSTDKNLFGRTGRPLKPSESARGKEEIFLAKVPIAFAVGHENPVNKLSLQQLEQIFTGKLTNWKQLGGPDAQIVTVGREPSEALFSELKHQYPFFQQSRFDVVLKKDHDVVHFLKSPAGNLAIAFGAAPNFTELKTVMLDHDFHAGVRLGLVYDQKNANHPLVSAVKSYAAGTQWKSLVRQADLLPAH